MRIVFIIAVALVVVSAGCVKQANVRFETVDKITAGTMLDVVDSYGAKSLDPPAFAVTSNGIGMLKKYEGQVRCKPASDENRHCPYNDSSNFCTIGYGHLIKKASCEDLIGALTDLDYLNGISEEEAEALLSKDLQWAQWVLERHMDVETGVVGSVKLTASQYDALVSFIFNVGEAQFSSSTLLKKLKARQQVDGNADVAQQFVRWAYSDGEFVQGLLNRRNEEVDQFFDGFDRPVTERDSSDDYIDIRVGE